MFSELCPVCQRQNYKHTEGSYETDGQKIDPDEGYCPDCGFHYSEYIGNPMSKQAEKYRDLIIDKWVEIFKVFK